MVAGYADVAVKLQRDWNLDAENLPFAKHVRSQALVSLVQKGLRYHHLSLTVDANGQRTRELEPSMFFFGPETYEVGVTNLPRVPLIKTNQGPRDVSPASTTTPSLRQRQRDPAPSATEEVPAAPPAKRGRKPTQSLAAERNAVNARRTPQVADPEPINGHAVAVSDVLPQAAPNLTSTVPLTNGNHEAQMQVDPEDPADVGTEDIDMIDETDVFAPPPLPMQSTLDIGDNRSIQATPSKVLDLSRSAAVLSLGATTTNISKVAWQLVDSAALLAQGDNFCGVWNLEGRDLAPGSVKPLPQNLFSTDQKHVVTAAAWHPRAAFLAVATYHNSEGQVYIFDGQDFALVETLSASHRAIMMLKWHPNRLQIIGVAPSGIENGVAHDVSPALLSWRILQDESNPDPSTFSLTKQIFDIDFGDLDSHLLAYASGEGGVRSLSLEDGTYITASWPSPLASASWTHIKCMSLSGQAPFVVTASADASALWLPDANILKSEVHAAPITGLELRPRRSHIEETLGTVQFATSSIDGLVKVWQLQEGVAELTCVAQRGIEPTLPVMALSFSPDGSCLAAASYNEVRIWNAEFEFNQMAKWRGADEEWRGTSIRDDDMMSAGGRSSVNSDGSMGVAEHSLAWRHDSKRLAFGLGSQLAVITFDR